MWWRTTVCLNTPRDRGKPENVLHPRRATLDPEEGDLGMEVQYWGTGAQKSREDAPFFCIGLKESPEREVD